MTGDYTEALSRIDPIHVLRLRDWLVGVGVNHIDRRARELVISLGSEDITIPNMACMESLLAAVNARLEAYATNIDVNEHGNQLRVHVGGACSILRVTVSIKDTVRTDLESIKNALDCQRRSRVIHAEVGTESWDPTAQDLEDVAQITSEVFEGCEVVVTRHGVKLSVVPEYAYVECSEACA